MDNSAVPITAGQLMEPFQSLDAEETTKAPIDSPDKTLAELTQHDGWQILKERIQTRVQALRGLTGAIEPSMSVEQVGFKFLAANLAAEELERVISDVEATASYVRDQRTTR